VNVLVVGVGNRDRGDDAVGLHVAEAARAALPENVAVRQVTAPVGLLELWEGYDAVYVLDAAMGGGAPGTVYRLDVTEVPLPASVRTVSTHGLGLAQVVELGRSLGRLPRRLVVYGVEVAAVDLGFALTSAVRAGVERAARQLSSEILEILGEGRECTSTGS